MKNPIVSGAVTVIAVITLGIGAKVTMEKIDNGFVGIEYSMNGGVKKNALNQGVHWVGLDKVTQYPIKTQTVKQKVALATSDGKKTETEITLSYHVDPARATDVYKKFGNVDIESIEKGWLNQQLTASGRKVLSKYSLLQVVGEESTKVQSSLLEEFRERADKQGFVIEDLSFGTPSLDDQTQKSIDDIIKAGQDNKKAELEAATKQTQAEAEAKAKTTAAQAEADANDKINNSITDNTIAYMEAQARQEHGWVTTQAGSAIVDK